MKKILFCIFPLPFSLINAIFTHEWGKLKTMMYTDFHSPFMLTESQIKFLVENFAIVSIEKCFGNRDGFSNNAIDAQYQTALQLKEASKNIKVLIYWSADLEGYRCNNLTHFLVDHPEWQLKDRYNNLVFKNEAPQLDFRIEEASEWWTNVMFDYSYDVTSLFDGALVDGPGFKPYFYENFDSKEKEELSFARFMALNKFNKKWNSRNIGTIIGNGIWLYGDIDAPKAPK